MPASLHLPRRARQHRSAARANALYGHGYQPQSPSILSVAHDAQNGGRVFLITDRPCTLMTYWPPEMPLDLSAGISPLPVVLNVAAISVVKFVIAYDRPIPQGCPWAWPAGRPHLFDSRTGNQLNAASATMDDVPGAYAPPAGALVTSASGSENSAVLIFNVPVWLVADEFGNPPTPDDAILFDGQAATAVVQIDPYTLQFTTASSIAPGSTWQIVRQPAWVVFPLENPTSGAFGI